ncbi:uncharacterized protein EV420DRAFT_1535774 [Desarmillaria tabescens]|uniref:Uncharacterized protein n=1 Tax=Armillaria tabescens TaxID=1929756 RepID=A0AA39KFT5_ARMTA|nr:uncharacterized protein EV420DRAFT_1535774 [Desarmillaria tabescens]KAK0460242.1 hypothetical protein EV420DRAFT_1535774 [Desarmillaria tabescens]
MKTELYQLQTSLITIPASVLSTALLPTGDAEASDSGSGSKTAIIGGVIGSVVFCVIIPLFLIIWKTRRSRRVSTNNSEDVIDPTTIPNPNPLLTEPIVTQMSRSPSPSVNATSISTVESLAPDPGESNDLLRRPPQSSRNAYEELISWLQQQIRHMDEEGIMRSTSPPPSYRSLHRSDIPDPSCSSLTPP